MKWCENDNAVNMDWTQKQMLRLEEHDLLIVWLIFILNAFIYGVRKLATEKCTCFFFYHQMATQIEIKLISWHIN